MTGRHDYYAKCLNEYISLNYKPDIIKEDD